MSYSVFDTKKIIDVIKYRWIWLLLSLCLLLPGIIAMVYSSIKYETHTPLLVGIDFTGGTIVQYEIDTNIPTDKVEAIRTKLIENRVENPVLQVLKSVEVGSENKDKYIISIKTSQENKTELIDKITSLIQEIYPDAVLGQIDSVGAVLGNELFINSMIAVGLALLGIVIYLTIRFRIDYAIAALLTLFHDVVFVIGIFSILGLFFGVHIDSLFVTAILTVLGYSINDTIVVFDRIRENVKFYSKKATYNEIVNASVNQTLARSVNTSLTTLITLGALYFFGGVTTKNFVLVMILGVLIGTYSSIFFASTLLALWNDIQEKRKHKAAEL